MKVSSEDKGFLRGHSLALKDAWMQVPWCPAAESWTGGSRGDHILFHETIQNTWVSLEHPPLSWLPLELALPT